MVSRILKWKYEFALLAISGLLLFTGLDKIEVNIMEARNFISAREMVQNDEYLLTTLNAEPRYQKPPLPTWLTALSGSIFGFDSLYALRLPVVAITFLLVFVFYFFSIRIGLSRSHSFNNALILITSFYIFFAGRDNQWDMYTHSFMMVSIYFLWKFLQENSYELRKSLISGLFLGFSILSKGPVSFYALLLPFIISYGFVYGISIRKKGFYLVSMLLTGLVVGLSWYVYVRLKDPIYFGIIALREASNWGTYEVKPFYYYWNFLIQSGLWAIPSFTALLYPYLKSRVNDLKAYRFGILWTLISVILLSVIPEKKVRYLVPVLIPLALTTGFYIEYLMNHFRSITRKEKNWANFTYGMIALIGFAFPFVLLFLLKNGIKDYLLQFVCSSLLMFTCFFSIVVGLIKADFRKVFYSIIALFVGVVLISVPVSQKLFHNPNYAPASKALTFEKQFNVNTYRLNDIAPEIIWDFGKPIPLIKQNIDNMLFPKEKQFGLMVEIGDTSIMKTQFPYYRIRKLYRINMYHRKSKKSRLMKDYYLVSQK